MRVRARRSARAAEVDLDARVRRRIREVVRDLGGERRQNEELKEAVERLENEQRDLARATRQARSIEAQASALGEVGQARTSAKAKEDPSEVTFARLVQVAGNSIERGRPGETRRCPRVR